MAREPLYKRILITIKFGIQYILCLFFRDLPSLIAIKKKSVANQVIVITGGAKGIGKGLAQKFALEQSAIVCIIDINEVEGNKTVAEINSMNGIAYYFECDVTKSEELLVCAQQIFNNSKIGRVDILICNAAILRLGKLIEMRDDDYKMSMEVNVLGYIYAVRTFIKGMMDRNCGQIVAIASVCSFYGDYLGTAYCTSKHAIRGFMETLQMELFEEGKTGIVLTTVYPYFTQTDLIADQMSEPFNTFYEVLPLEKCVEQIVDAVLKERYSYFIPWTLAILCIYAKGYVTKHNVRYVRRLFNCKYMPLPKLSANEMIVKVEH